MFLRISSRDPLLIFPLYVSFLLLVACQLFAQQPLGSIIGHVRVLRGGAPSQRVLVDLEYRGASMDSVYTDGEGTFGFHQLGPNTYTVVIKDDHYEPIEEPVVLEATTMSPLAIVEITLKPKASAPAVSSSQPQGSNPNIADAREYASHFPKQVRKEFDKGVAADDAGKKEDAIKHYQKTLAIAPDYYPAHNNLGSDYLSKSDFTDARKEFEAVIRLNQSDAEGYFNLSNVCMMTGQLADAQHYLEEGMRRDPDSALGHFLLGSLEIKAGKYSQAEAVLRHTIQLSPTMAQARLQLVNALLQQGKKADAENELRDFISSFPDSPYTPKARQLLERIQAKSPSGSPK
jgi:Flp pilus assembly protein TadD